jgi:hypothetical protein
MPWSYAIPFDAGIDDFDSYARLSSQSPWILLLKLHGSLNWYQCRKCGLLRLFYFTKYKQLYSISLRKCAACSEPSFRPLLVAPTPMKVFPSALERAWRLAGECLRKASALVIIGYSFPPNDRKSRTLFLREFIIPNLSRKKRPGLVLVNPSCRVRESIRELFSPAVDHVKEHKRFEDYCAADLREEFTLSL